MSALFWFCIGGICGIAIASGVLALIRGAFEGDDDPRLDEWRHR